MEVSLKSYLYESQTFRLSQCCCSIMPLMLNAENKFTQTLYSLTPIFEASVSSLVKLSTSGGGLLIPPRVAPASLSVLRNACISAGYLLSFDRKLLVDLWQLAFLRLPARLQAAASVSLSFSQVSSFFSDTYTWPCFACWSFCSVRRAT